MPINIVPSSPKVAEVLAAEAKTESAVKAPKYPFDQLEPGQSFTVEKASANIASLKTICSRKSKDGRKFILVQHDDLSPPVVEVARVS